MTFILGSRSLGKLEGVAEPLAECVKLAITLTTQDFAVHEGLRSIETQREYVRRGVSRTMNSKHLTGRAVDLVPYVNGVLRWEWPLIYPIALAMNQARDDLGVSLTWGGVWDRSLEDCGDSTLALAQSVRDYSARHPGPDFLDGPHYELRP